MIDHSQPRPVRSKRGMSGQSGNDERGLLRPGQLAAFCNASGAARIAGVLLGVLAASSCAEDSELRVVATGRYVELATDRDDPVCAGTVWFYDRFIEAGFAFIGEVPPDRVFVRYEWIDVDDDSTMVFARRNGEDVQIRIPELIHEHELAHAIHLQAWPMSANFLHEGFAVLVDPRNPFAQQPSDWADGFPLDEVLGATEPTVDVYVYGWFLVSQILADHGIAGLREFWHAVPRGASAEAVRSAYQSLFGRPIEALLEPWVLKSDVPELDGATGQRSACTMVFCTGDEKPWDGDVWSAAGPTGCEDDLDAVGPDAWYSDHVWRDYVLNRDAGPYEPDPANPADLWVSERCAFLCDHRPPSFYGTDEPALRDTTRSRVAVHAEFDALPTDMPTEIRYLRTE